MKFFLYLFSGFMLMLTTWSSLSLVTYAKGSMPGYLPYIIFLFGVVLFLLIVVINNVLNKRYQVLEALLKNKSDLLEKQMASDLLNQEKRNFLARMSHDLRTPLNSIILLTDLMSNDYGNDLSQQKIKEYNNVIGQSANLLMSMLNDLLDISKIEAGVLDIQNEANSIEKILDEVKQTFEPVAIQKGLSLIVDSKSIGAELILDKKILLKVLFNVLSNAIKFTNRGSVTLIFEEIDSQWVFRILDTGCGIHESNYLKIFEYFGFDDSRPSEVKRGLGLGLGIVKKMVEILGGVIVVKSQLDVGSEFIIKINKQKMNLT